MKPPSLTLLAAAGLSAASLAGATPPTDPGLAEKIDRTAPKIPKLQSKNPRYALAVFGKEADHQAWIVLDLDRDPAKPRTLDGRIYVDRDGDGDLTEADDQIELPKTDSSFYRFPEIELTDSDGKRTGYRLELMAGVYDPEDQNLHLRIYVHSPKEDRFGAWGDQNSDLVFASAPEKAPVIHFDGPLQMGFEVPEPLTKQNQHYRLAAGVGTYGIGDGTFAYQFYRTIPDDVHPDVVIEWPAADPEFPPRKTVFILKDRC